MYAGVYFLGYCFGIISSVMSVSCAKTFPLNNNMPAISILHIFSNSPRLMSDNMYYIDVFAKGKLIFYFL